MTKKKILIDLDVVTVAIWDKNKSAVDFLTRIKSGEFEVYTPYSLFDLLDRWGFENLRDKIKEFYELNSTEIITARRLTETLDELKVNEADITIDLKNESIKEEDILLISINLGLLVLFRQMRFSPSYLGGIFKEFFSHTSLNLISKLNQFLSGHVFRVFHTLNNIKPLYKHFA